MNKKRTFLNRLERMVEKFDPNFPEHIEMVCPGNRELSVHIEPDDDMCDLCVLLILADTAKQISLCPCYSLGPEEAYRRAKKLIEEEKHKKI